MIHWRREGEVYCQGLNFGYIRGPFFAFCWKKGDIYRRIKLRWRIKPFPYYRSFVFSNIAYNETLIRASRASRARVNANQP